MLCVIFIEVIRGVPLDHRAVHGQLYHAAIVHAAGLDGADKLLRAIVGVAIFFTSAYMAEVIRGGLQAIPKSVRRRRSRSASAIGRKCD